MNNARRSAADYKWAMAMLAGLAAAPPLINLIQSGFDVRLNWGFSHFVAFYRALLEPVSEFLQWPIRYLFRHFRIDWVMPSWAKDLQILSLIGSGLYVRAWGIGKYAVKRALDRDLNAFTGAKPPFGPIGYALYQSILAFVIGFTGIGLFIWILIPISLARISRARRSWPGEIRGEFGLIADLVGTNQLTQAYRMRMAHLLVAVAAVAVAVLVFYVGNAILPQLGFS